MSQENVDIVRRGFELWAACLRDQSDVEAAEALVALYSHDAEIDFSQTTPDMPPKRGLRVMTDWIQTARGVFEDVRLVTGKYRENGDFIVVPVRLEARGIGSGAPTEMNFVYVFRVSQGRIAMARTFHGEQDALQAAGLSG